MKFINEIFKKEEIDTFGLDIGSSLVKLVYFQNNPNNLRLKKVCFSEIDAPINSADPLGKEKCVKKAIENCFAIAGIETKYAVCAIGGSDVAVKSFNFPNMPTEEIAKAVYLEAEQVCPFDVSQCVVDYNIVCKENTKVQGVLVASTVESITKKTKLVKAAQLSPVVMDSEALALLNCYNSIENPPQNKATAILDIGSSFSTIIIAYDSKPPFVRELETSGNGIINWIKENSSSSIEQIRGKLFKNISIAGEFDLDYQLAGACQNLVNEIEETMKFYERNYNKVVEEILVCGGFANIDPIIEIIAGRVAISVKKWNPLKNVQFETDTINNDIIDDYGPCMALAAGLALRKV